MKPEHILRHMADNVENGRDAFDRLIYCGKKPGNFRAWYAGDILKHSEHFTIAPKTHMVNGFEVPAPMTEKPEDGDVVFISSVSSRTWVIARKWSDDEYVIGMFNRGMCHSEYNSAIYNAQAMAKVNPYE